MENAKICTGGCSGDPKPLSEFHKSKTGRLGCNPRCKSCCREYRKAYHANNREYFRKACKAWRQKNRERAKQLGFNYRQALKLDVLSHYAKGDSPECECCGETIPEFLCLDHIDGGGNRHRDALKRSGTRFYTWIRKNGYPSGFRVLCNNCNMAIGWYGVCPHQRREA